MSARLITSECQLEECSRRSEVGEGRCASVKMAIYEESQLFPPDWCFSFKSRHYIKLCTMNESKMPQLLWFFTYSMLLKIVYENRANEFEDTGRDRKE